MLTLVGEPIEVVHSPRGAPKASTDFLLFDLEKILKKASLNAQITL
jgi:hypothetical protein